MLITGGILLWAALPWPAFPRSETDRAPETAPASLAGTARRCASTGSFVLPEKKKRSCLNFTPKVESLKD
jgi:hypothetical protein